MAIILESESPYLTFSLEKIYLEIINKIHK